MEILEYLKDIFEYKLKESKELIEEIKKGDYPQWSIGYRQGHCDALSFVLDRIETEIEKAKKSPYKN